ncbi:UNVERIFIED_CONTAM: putative mitochondrial protein [Sesamum latifolium]|uniref:Mitochondrial protein n=1 Tax=Sesamum latifolium TaxID=2727402 RepID=A0AAW2VUC8_9LAMI
MLEETYAKLEAGTLDRDRYAELESVRVGIEECHRSDMLKWKQLSKTHWLQDIDNNTRFFHSYASTPKWHNMIKRLRDEEGMWKEQEEDIQGILLRYFRDIFTSSGPSDSELNEVLALIQPWVSLEMNQVLAAPFTATEVKSAIFVMFPFKFPGPNGIPPFQSAFIHGRLITDNVLLAFELNHYIQGSRQSKGECIALKLDMSKAYDMVEWAFLRGTLLRLGFNHRFVGFIMLLVSTVSYSLTLNGNQFGYFFPERGIRQGDPLSPYMFIFYAGVFSCMLQDAELWGQLTGVTVARQAPRVSHLLFADDTLVFCKASLEDISEIGWILRCYAQASG